MNCRQETFGAVFFFRLNISLLKNHKSQDELQNNELYRDHKTKMKSFFFACGKRKETEKKLKLSQRRKNCFQCHKRPSYEFIF